MPAKIVLTHTPELFSQALRRAADLLRAGEVVAIPTETVYGLSANALDAPAVARIFAAKGRPAHNPVIVHVVGFEMVRRVVREWPPPARKCAEEFWPGPLTLVLPRHRLIPDLVTAGGDTVAVRWPAHPFAQALIRECDFPLAAPSANVSEELSPTNAEHVRKGLGDRIPLIVDGGPCQVGIESTVLDLTAAVPRILRLGMISAEALRRVLPALELGDGTGAIRRSPGQLPRHYAPRARLLVLRWNEDEELRNRIRQLAAAPERIHIIAHGQIPNESCGAAHISVIPADPEAFARALYHELHRCDEAGAEWIVVEEPPSGSEWAAITDRLRRATGQG